MLAFPCFDEALGVLLQIGYRKGDCPTNITLAFKSTTLWGVFLTLHATDNMGTEESHDWDVALPQKTKSSEFHLDWSGSKSLNYLIALMNIHRAFGWFDFRAPITQTAKLAPCTHTENVSEFWQAPLKSKIKTWGRWGFQWGVRASLNTMKKVMIMRLSCYKGANLKEDTGLPALRSISSSVVKIMKAITLRYHDLKQSIF